MNQYLKVDKWVNASMQDNIDKLEEEYEEVGDELDYYVTVIFSGRNLNSLNPEKIIEELHDLAQISNTLIYKLCKEHGINYESTVEAHQNKIKSRTGDQ